ncbi:hypothetical protein ACFORJ_08220 [Corynebacterium hansenii]|uniref:Uncharacterized protein n=1 Tax=Corynebacterium hansenii TaxID=394964 RepID=A0ABV7ZPP0_9CORY|nr:hypothetical protein [Corynebacterium hansenii]WJZ00737.1 hypothetical protein CHAN_10685 [Corynebacterium hansenii]
MAKGGKNAKGKGKGKDGGKAKVKDEDKAKGPAKSKKKSGKAKSKKAAAGTTLRLPECSKAEAKAAKKLAGKDPFRLAAMSPKKKCCKSGTRCLRCPVVLHKLNREIRNGEVDRDALLLVAAKARVR